MVPLRWGAEGLLQQLQQRLPEARVEVLASCASTNTLLLERARGGEFLPCLLVAEEQTAGRGRLGRAWHSAPGASLTASLALPYAPADWQGLSLAVGLALAEALDPGAQGLQLKWPNDLWLADAPGQGRKLGGVLIETMAAGEQRIAVIGFGLNVLPQPEVAGLPPRSCWQEIEPAASAPLALQRLLLPLVAMLQSFERSGFAPLAERFTRRDLLRGQPIRTTQAGVPEGLADGVDARGALRVLTPALQLITSGEVSVRPAPNPAAAQGAA